MLEMSTLQFFGIKENKGHKMRDTCNTLWCHFKALTLRKWANIILIGESLPGSVDLI